MNVPYFLHKIYTAQTEPIPKRSGSVVGMQILLLYEAVIADSFLNYLIFSKDDLCEIPPNMDRVFAKKTSATARWLGMIFRVGLLISIEWNTYIFM